MVLVIRNMKARKRSAMRKQGPCCHCGVNETPLWRNGPPEKPVLCNACGSRWRIRGNLDAYVPNKRGSAVHRGKKRSRKNNPFKWIENEDDEEEEDSNNDDESDEEWTGDNRCKKSRYSDSISESMTSEEPGKLYEVPVVMQSEIIISDDDEKDGSSDDSHVVVVEEIKVQDNYVESSNWVDQSDDDGDDDEDPLAHIKMLRRELYKMFKNEKSSSSTSSSCSSLAESSVEDEVLLYNVSNPHFSENEIGFGSFLIKSP